VQSKKPAKGPTGEEFAAEVLGPALAVAQEVVSEYGLAGVKPMVSFDNDKIHISALKQQAHVLEEWGWEANMRLELSPYSPDMHRVIEHTHGLAVMKFRHWLYNRPETDVPMTVQQYQTAFEHIYKQCCTPDVIAADVAGLPEVYQYVYNHDGDWAPKWMR
jgi:hypothetical protein